MKFKDPWRLPVCEGLQQWTPGPHLRLGCYTSVPQLVGGTIWKSRSCQALESGRVPLVGQGPREPREFLP